jgi:hypothetical protein
VGTLHDNLPPGLFPRTRVSFNAAALQAMATVPIVVWLYGWQRIDLVEWRTLTASPFTLALDPSQQFLYGSPFSHLLGAYYQRQGIDVAASFIVVHGLGLLLLAYAAMRALVARCGADQWGAAALVLGASPLLLTIVSWIGKDDVFLLAFYLLMLASPSALTRGILSAAMILCHRELGVAMLIAHAILRREGLAIALGALTGVALSYVYTNVLMDVAPQTRVDYMIAHARGLVRGVIAHPFAHFVAALGPFWLFVFRPASITVRRMAVVGMATVLASMTLDFTRIFVLVSTPLLIDVAEDVVSESREHGGVALFGFRWPVAIVGLLAFLPLQLAGDRLSWINGVSWVLAR